MSAADDDGDVASSKPFVSVVIPVYNDPIGIQLTLESVTNQTYPTNQYEIVVADNGSTDATREAVDRYLARYPDLVNLVVEDEAHKPAAARNAGIEASCGDILAFIDADMTVEVDWLASVIEIFERSEHDYMGCQVETYPPGGQETTSTIYDRLTLFRMGEYLTESNSVGAGCLTVRRAVIDTVGGFDSHLDFMADVEFGNRVHAAGFDQHFEPSITMYHPARASVWEHLQKSLKVGRGGRQLAHLHPEHFDAPSLFRLRNYLPPHPRRFIARLDDQLGDENRFSWRERISLYALDCVQKYARSAGSLYEYVSSRENEVIQSR